MKIGQRDNRIVLMLKIAMILMQEIMMISIVGKMSDVENGLKMVDSFLDVFFHSIAEPVVCGPVIGLISNALLKILNHSKISVIILKEKTVII